MADSWEELAQGMQQDNSWEGVAKDVKQANSWESAAQEVALTPAQADEARLGHLAVAPSVPIPAWLEDYLIRSGRRFAQNTEAFSNIPQNLANTVTGGGPGRLQSALHAAAGVFAPLTNLLTPFEAASEQAATTVAPEHVAQIIGDWSTIPLAVALGRADQAGKLGNAGQNLAELLGVRAERPVQPTRADVQAAGEVPLSDVIPSAPEFQHPRPSTPGEEELINALLQPEKPKPQYESVWVPDITPPSNAENVYDRMHGQNRFNPEMAAEATAQGKPYLGTHGTYDSAPDLIRNQPIYDHLIQMKQEADPQQLVERSIRDTAIQNAMDKIQAERHVPGGPNAIYPGNAPRYVGTKETERVLANVQANEAGIVRNPIVERVSQRAGQRLTQLAETPPAPSGVAEKVPSTMKVFWDNLARNSSDMIGSFGASGRELARRVKQAAFDAETQLTGLLEGPMGGLEMSRKLKITPEEDKNITAVLEGLAAPMNERVRTVANLVRPQLESIAGQTGQAGLEIRNMITGEVKPFQPRPDFVPHFTNFDQVIANPAARVQAIQQIENEARAAGKMLTPGQAEGILNQMRRHSRHEYGHLEVARTLNMSDYEKRFSMWYPRYMKGATERLAEARQFGPRFEVADNLINMVGRETGSDWYQSLARQYFDRVSGREVFGGGMQAMQKFNEFMMPIQVATKLSHAVIANYTQRFYPAFMGGYANLAKAWRQALSEQGQQFGRVAGASIESTMRDIMEATMAGPSSNRVAELARKVGTKVLDFTQFSKVEVMNRMIAANYGQVWAKDMMAQLPGASGRTAETLKRNLRNLGIEPMEVLARGGTLTPDQLIGAGRKMIEMTQFKTNVKDLPLSWTNPLGRLISQFSTFAFKSGKFTYDHVLKEAIKGNMTPIATFLLSGSALGEGVADIKSWVGNRERPHNIAARLAENLAYIGSLGIWYDALQSAQYGEIGTARRLLGPTISDINALGSAVLTGNGRSIAQQATQQIPLVGPYLRPRLFPPKKKNTGD